MLLQNDICIEIACILLVAEFGNVVFNKRCTSCESIMFRVYGIYNTLYAIVNRKRKLFGLLLVVHIVLASH